MQKTRLKNYLKVVSAVVCSASVPRFRPDHVQGFHQFQTVLEATEPNYYGTNQPQRKPVHIKTYPYTHVDTCTHCSGHTRRLRTARFECLSVMSVMCCWNFTGSAMKISALHRIRRICNLRKKTDLLIEYFG